MSGSSSRAVGKPSPEGQREEAQDGSPDVVRVCTIDPEPEMGSQSTGPTALLTKKPPRHPCNMCLLLGIVKMQRN